MGGCFVSYIQKLTSGIKTSMNKIQNMATEIVNDFVKICPPPEQRSQQRHFRQKKIKQALDQLLSRLKNQCKEQHLGIIGKIRIIYAIQRIIKNHEYEPTLTRQVVTAMIFAVLSRD